MPVALYGAEAWWPGQKDRRYALRPRSRPPNNNDNRHEEVTVARLRRIVREKAATAFKSWWERAAPARYKELGIQLASGCPPELELTRATLHRLLAARSGHGDFAEYHERFEHEDAVLECSCGKRKAPEHLLLCDKVRTRDRPRLVGSCRDKIRTLLAGPPKKFANFVEKTDFYGKICPRTGTGNV